MESEKICINCGTSAAADVEACPVCGSIHFDRADEAIEQSISDAASEGPSSASDEPIIPASPAAPAAVETVVPTSPKKSDNVAAGIVGAFLLSLIGVAVYFGVYQLGFIAGICGFIIFILANFGYGLFCGNKQSDSKARIIISIVISIIMIALAEYICVAFEVFMAFKEEGMPITFIQALRAVPMLLHESEILGEVLKDLLIAYGLGIVATISTVIKMVKDRKTSKA